ncbi:uncharacterized protein LOC117176977 [Belonocnema kinseyi]|uniref:uncharacterized protein LOC117176977 n=1 Tax=Belonocnema kinseyi TaxID=2817044 RepID=UPI00143D3BF3|nr:uncharacterized protein LOC117176977 [Belonocnema kinseyi]XP_033223304.1 uncharacterized protein LOC117176977 [Belonocnema kinseyi]
MHCRRRRCLKKIASCCLGANRRTGQGKCVPAYVNSASGIRHSKCSSLELRSRRLKEGKLISSTRIGEEGQDARSTLGKLDQAISRLEAVFKINEGYFHQWLL